MSEKSFPREANDFPINRKFYPESLKPQKDKENEGFLEDPAEITGNEGDLGGGYNSLENGEIPQPAEENSFWPNNEQRAIGLEGVKNARESLERAKNPDQPQENIN